MCTRGTQHRVPQTVGLPNINETGLLSMPHGRCDVPLCLRLVLQNVGDIYTLSVLLRGISRSTLC